MRFFNIYTLALPLSTMLLIPCAEAHPGHEHSPGVAAAVVHSITEWGPLLLVAGVVVATAFRFWRARGK